MSPACMGCPIAAAATLFQWRSETQSLTCAPSLKNTIKSDPHRSSCKRTTLSKTQPSLYRVLKHHRSTSSSRHRGTQTCKSAPPATRRALTTRCMGGTGHIHSGSCEHMTTARQQQSTKQQNCSPHWPHPNPTVCWWRSINLLPLPAAAAAVVARTAGAAAPAAAAAVPLELQMRPWTRQPFAAACCLCFLAAAAGGSAAACRLSRRPFCPCTLQAARETAQSRRCGSVVTLRACGTLLIIPQLQKTDAMGLQPPQSTGLTRYALQAVLPCNHRVTPNMPTDPHSPAAVGAPRVGFAQPACTLLPVRRRVVVHPGTVNGLLHAWCSCFYSPSHTHTLQPR